MSAVVLKNAKEFKQSTKRRMIESSAGGKTYERGRGEGFSRSNRASRRGQRPSPDTSTLVNAVSDRRTGVLSSEVLIAHKRNPENGEYADEYAEKLQLKMNRSIMNSEDRSIAQKKLDYDCSKAVEQLTK